MNNGNGHHNGRELADKLMPPGDPELRGARSTMLAVLKTMDDHCAREIPIPTALLEAFPILVGRLMSSKDDRVQAMALKAINAAQKYNLDRFALADKLARLEGGEPTERVETRELRVEFDRMG